jgi:hypothetical protein
MLNGSPQLALGFTSFLVYPATLGSSEGLYSKEKLQQVIYCNDGIKQEEFGYDFAMFSSHGVTKPFIAPAIAQ